MTIVLTPPPPVKDDRYDQWASSVLLPYLNAYSPSSIPVPVSEGGTGLVAYAIGDLLYASAATTLSKLADVATGNVLISGGVGAAPSWGKVSLTTHVSGILPDANITSTLTGKTYNGLTLTAAATGFTIAGGTTSKTLTVALDASVSGTNTGDQTISLSSEASGSGTGSISVTLSNAAVIAKVLTDYTSGPGVVAATDSILAAIQKLNGNDGAIYSYAAHNA